MIKITIEGTSATFGHTKVTQEVDSELNTLEEVTALSEVTTQSFAEAIKNKFPSQSF